MATEMTVKKHLILVKHSLPGIVETIPAREWKLSEEGKRRAEILAERLIFFGPQVLIASTEPKAIETAQVIGRRLQLPLEILESLHEHERSKVAYLPKDKLERAISDFFVKPELLVFGSETANEAYERFYAAVSSVLDAYHDKTTIIVSHGTVISLFLSHLTGIAALQLWHELGLPSFVVLDMNTNMVVARENII
jgi:broad specificity phosphatase PhoE